MKVTGTGYLKSVKKVKSEKEGKSREFTFVKIIDENFYECEILVSSKLEELPEIENFSLSNYADYEYEFEFNVSSKGLCVLTNLSKI